MKTFLLLFTAICSLQASAQYYYKDIVGTAESNTQMQAYKAGNVKRVALASFDGDNTRTEGFSVAQQFDAGSGILRTVTQTGEDAATVLTTYADAAGRVVKTVDSSATSISTTEYNYRPDGKLLLVKSLVTDAKGGFPITETHEWQYEGDQVKAMTRTRNGREVTALSFVKDEKGNIIEEHSLRNGVKGEPVYYYYNDKNQLTDIVRFNSKAKRLLPEYMFEYNDKGQVIQRITFPSNNSNYTIWRYQYNPQGLRTREAIYNKQKELTGKVEYSYQ
ncbi:YD repeat-containing protein [Cnuella takakiae]|uniref:YD repeat-containing protein n=1 Tax=Cnuella takakiae TaxID=1302690 RepID=A0A1M5FYB9_9BACT|nr:hypothetical protein [Cnuella takakiae]OLY92259.1 hypothetical protein BUE76_10410 [Cnuella takakiae]SHF96525.1 YD repeat-containing protein [Cnuella takakiae]